MNKERQNKDNLRIKKLKTYNIIISGIVQGVGFRPFIYKTAVKNNLKGNVANTTEGVVIKINVKDKSGLLKVLGIIKKNKPEPAIIEKIIYKKIPYEYFDDFIIRNSMEAEEKFQLISPDIATCKNCINDINNISDKRRFYYPFTNCTNCGPRFTIIKKMPYDRPNTTMADFIMCPDCAKEYGDPLNRRFHAQPNACSICGPKLILLDKNGKQIDDKKPIQSALEKIKNGKIVGIKSLGGFQIACDATNDEAVFELRKRKNRPFKPFAVMFPDIEEIKKYLKVSNRETISLLSAASPVVLLRKRKNNNLSKQVSFYNKYDGVFLPYTPIHHLLFRSLRIPLVMTSGNISEEPISSKNDDAIKKLSNICDYFLVHNRDIYSKYDDSVIKIFNNKEMIIRRARGYAPYPVKLDYNIGNKVILATGAQEKNTFCLFKKNYAILSQHIGDLDNFDSMEFFKSTMDNYKKLFNIENIDIAAYDNHPGYYSTKFALKNFDSSIKTGVQHHKAHIAAVIAENNLLSQKNNLKNILGFAWDGTGYGDDGKIWGSEIFMVDKNLNFNLVGHLKEKYLPGGEITIKKPYRMALAYLYNLWKVKGWTHKSDKNINFIDFVHENFTFYKKIIKSAEIEIIIKQLETGFNSPVTTSMGRFFDACSSILNLTHLSSYEGEAAVHLEMESNENISGEYDIKFNYGNIIEIDDFHIFSQIISDITDKIPASVIAAKFHNTMAKITLEISNRFKEKSGIDTVALSGGVFQNNFLLKKCFKILQKNGFRVYSNFLVPVNDGGISLGQAYFAAVNSNYTML